MSERGPTAGFLGLLAVGLGVCCGLPLLASIGVLGAVVGLAVGSWLLIAVGAAVAAGGIWRWRRRTPRASTSPATHETDGPQGEAR